MEKKFAGLQLGAVSIHKIKSLWVKHSWFYSNHENHKDITPDAIWYMGPMMYRTDSLTVVFLM